MYYTLMGLTLISTPSSYLIVNCLYFSRWSFYYLKQNPYCCAFSVILWKEEPLKLPCLVSHYTCPNTLPTHTHIQARTCTFHALPFPMSVRFMFTPLSPQLVSARRMHLPHPSLSHVLGASDITLTLPHCPTYERQESARDEGDRGSRRRGWGRW